MGETEKIEEYLVKMDQKNHVRDVVVQENVGRVQEVLSCQRAALRRIRWSRPTRCLGSRR
jgi:hypothetical protein